MKCDRCEAAVGASKMVLTVSKSDPPRVVGAKTLTCTSTFNVFLDLCFMRAHDLRMAFGKIDVEVTKVH